MNAITGCDKQSCSLRPACTRLLHQFAKSANNAYDKVTKVTGGTAYQAHHVLQNSVMEKLFKTYTKQLGFAVPLLGGWTMKGSPHAIANLIQSRLKGREVTFVGFAALRAAGCRNGDATEIVLAATRYSEIMGWL